MFVSFVFVLCIVHCAQWCLCLMPMSVACVSGLNFVFAYSLFRNCMDTASKYDGGLCSNTDRYSTQTDAVKILHLIIVIK
jgi:hypothetical protein